MPDSPQQRRTVEAVLRLERKTMDAIRARDAKALEGVLAEEFVYRAPGAEQNRAEFLKAVASFPGRILSVEGTELRVNVYGETAVLTGVQHARVGDEKGAELTSTVAFTDIFVRRGGRWRLALAHAVEIAPQVEERKR
jgi:ketosteroid isomerase-like protein